MFRRFSLSLMALAVVGCGGGDSHRQTATYPNRPIQLIVPFGAGGGTDAFARIVVKAIQQNKLSPQPIVIINVGGAGATIGSRRVKNARPDGYTLLILHDAILTAKLSRTVNYGPEAFEPVAGTAVQGMVIAVREDSPFATLPELLQAAKAKPDSVVFGANLGAMTHYAGLLLEAAHTGAQFRYTQEGGGAERFAKLMGGHIAVTGFSTEEFLRYRAKGMRGLAVLSRKRQPALPEIPAAREQQIDVVVENTFYWWVPKGTPQPRIDVLANVLKKAMETKEVRRYLEEVQCPPPDSPARSTVPCEGILYVRGKELAARIARSAESYAGVSPGPPPHVPNYVAAVLIAIATLVLLRIGQIWRTRTATGDSVSPDGKVSSAANGSADASRLSPPRIAAACLVTGLTFLYFAVMSLGWVAFPWATTAFVLGTGALLVRLNSRSLALLATMALLLGFGLHAVLENVFDVYLS